jgi:hypothetical protein
VIKKNVLEPSLRARSMQVIRQPCPVFLEEILVHLQLKQIIAAIIGVI